jgi:hypothetical protein
MNTSSYAEEQAWMRAAEQVVEAEPHQAHESGLSPVFIYGNYLVMCSLLAEKEAVELGRGITIGTTKELALYGLLSAHNVQSTQALRSERLVESLFAQPAERLFFTLNHARTVESEVATSHGYQADGHHPVRLNESTLVNKLREANTIR